MQAQAQKNKAATVPGESEKLCEVKQKEVASLADCLKNHQITIFMVVHKLTLAFLRFTNYAQPCPCAASADSPTPSALFNRRLKVNKTTVQQLCI